MDREEVLRFFRPERLVVFTDDVMASAGHVIVAKGALVAAKLYHLDHWGAEVAIFSGPIDVKAMCSLTTQDMADKIRPASADEERSWLTRAEQEGGVTT